MSNSDLLLAWITPYFPRGKSFMGEVFRVKDVTKGRRRMMENATRDLSPGVRDAARQILRSWKGVDSEEELKRLLGEKKALSIIDRIREHEEE